MMACVINVNDVSQSCSIDKNKNTEELDSQESCTRHDIVYRETFIFI